LYGATIAGGKWGYGVVFRVNKDGTGFTNLHSFETLNINGSGPYTNSEGACPNSTGGLVLSSNTIYGTTDYGGSSGGGTVFKINTDGSGFTNLHSFVDGSFIGFDTTSGLLLSSNILFGLTQAGGNFSNGTVFCLNLDGTGFTNLHSFTTLVNGTNCDLTFSANTLYGTAGYGGLFGVGTVFAINTDGTGFTNLYSFNFSGPNTDGVNPSGKLLLSGNMLYGTTQDGGSSGDGTVFSLALPPPSLTITHTSTNAILTWPTYAPGVSLQSSTNLISPSIWSTNLPAPALVNGQNAVTNPISGSQMFFRLSQ
jgi:uncharacterized repeat protein (TIGR03803 family)